MVGTNGVVNGTAAALAAIGPPPAKAGPTPAKPRRKRLRQIEGAERLDVAQLEQLIGYSRRTVERWIVSGGFPAPHYLGRGRKRVWIASEVRTWIAENDRSGAATPGEPA